MKRRKNIKSYIKTLKLYFEPFVYNNIITSFDFWDDNNEKYVFGINSKPFVIKDALDKFTEIVLNELKSGKTFIIVDIECRGEWKYNENGKKIIEFKDPLIGKYHMKTAHFVQIY